MDLEEYIKSSNCIENECPSTSKRCKLSAKQLRLINEDEDPKILEEMGIGILGSDESSSSSSSTYLLPPPETVASTATRTTIALSNTSSNSVNISEKVCHNNDDKNSNINPSENLDLSQNQQQQYNELCDEKSEKNFQKSTNTNNNNNNNNSLSLDNNEASNFNIRNDDLNDTLTTSVNNYKIDNTSIEVYLDNNIKANEKIHKKFGNNNNNSSFSKGRSPLAIVSCNNMNNINQNNNNNPSMTDISKKQQQQQQYHQQAITSNETFFLYRNRLQKQNNGKDPFKKLSDEMILQIFKWLPKKTLMRCGYVCRRFNQLAQDESLWTRLDLAGKKLKSGAIGKIVCRGVVILRLAQAEISHPVFELDSIEYLPEFETKLQYLDLTMAVITKPSLKMLLSKCRQLKKLSLEHIKLNDDICYEISKNCNLEALNLTMCEGLESWSIKKMMSELKQLHSLNISWTSLNIESVKALVDNVTPDLLRLNIAGCRKAMFDSHLLILSKRCPGLLELDLSDCTALTSTAIDLICDFKDLEYLSLSRCYGITATSYMKLNNLTSLSYLDVFGLLSDTALTVLQNTFPTVGINKFIYSSVARPTVGTRRTSIWGLRTRD